MISVNKVSVFFGGTPLFNSISFLVNKGDRIGLVGKNGAGKSTLLKILASEMEADAGVVSKTSGYKIGYLPQELDFVSGKTVREEAESCFEEIKALELKIIDLNESIATRTDYESDSYMDLISEYSEAEERFHLLGGGNYHSKLERILKGLGFKDEDFSRLTDEFSGGWRMRLELAKLLLQELDLLLLDEPTNHLDIESIMWLEKFLSQSGVAVILVSHDRAFLDAVTNRTIEISFGKIYDYKCSYSKYVGLRAERRDQQVLEKKNQDKEIKHTEQLIEKFRYKASKAAFAQSLIKKLEKMDRIQVDEEENAAMRLRFSTGDRSGKVVLEVEQLSKSFDEKVILTDIDLQLARGEKIAFVGQNGQGKTTLAKCIVNEHQYEGSVKLGHNVQLGYFAQNQSELIDGEKSVLQLIEDAATDAMRPRVRDLLGSFMFSGEAVDKKVKVLSGGERGRLALCKLLLEPSNFLVLDEPTNHLDMRSKEILKEALRQFDGTMILVSHDRDFLQGLTDKVVEFSDGAIHQHIGDINSFLEKKSLENFKELEKQGNIASAPNKKKISKELSFEERKQLDREIKKSSNKLGQYERDIDKLENEIARLDKELSDPDLYNKYSADPEFFNKYNLMKKELEEKMSLWEKQEEEVEDLKSQRDNI